MLDLQQMIWDMATAMNTVAQAQYQLDSLPEPTPEELEEVKEA